MVEAILVMAILGVIAAIMITNLKPATFKDRALEIKAKQLLTEIDDAINQIIINDSKHENLFSPRNSSGTLFTFDTYHYSDVAEILKKYLASTRKTCSGSECTCSKTYMAQLNEGTYIDTLEEYGFYLKDGACVNFFVGNNFKTIFPGEDSPTTMTNTIRVIVFDTNGEEEPNKLGKDIFIVPLGLKGILYEGFTDLPPAATSKTAAELKAEGFGPMGWVWSTNPAEDCRYICVGLNEAAYYRPSESSSGYGCYCK